VFLVAIIIVLVVGNMAIAVAARTIIEVMDMIISVLKLC
jgi:hypothetical protein